MPKKLVVSTDAPGWLVTFGDMMTQILCFFVMLFSMSSVKKNALYETARTIREDRGLQGVIDTQTGTSKEQTFSNAMQSLTAEGYSKFKESGGEYSKGVPGEETSVRVADEGLRVELPVHASFERGSALLNPAAKQALTEVAKRVQGLRNRIDIRGHDDAVPYGPAESLPGARWTPEDRVAGKWDMGYFRARAVAEFLESQGIVPQRLRITSCGRMEPASADLFSRQAQTANRRVEVIVTEEEIPAEGDEARLR